MTSSHTKSPYQNIETSKTNYLYPKTYTPYLISPSLGNSNQLSDAKPLQEVLLFQLSVSNLNCRKYYQSQDLRQFSLITRPIYNLFLMWQKINQIFVVFIYNLANNHKKALFLQKGNKQKYYYSFSKF